MCKGIYWHGINKLLQTSSKEYCKWKMFSILISDSKSCIEMSLNSQEIKRNIKEIGNIKTYICIQKEKKDTTIIALIVGFLLSLDSSKPFREFIRLILTAKLQEIDSISSSRKCLFSRNLARLKCTLIDFVELSSCYGCRFLHNPSLHISGKDSNLFKTLIQIFYLG